MGLKLLQICPSLFSTFLKTSREKCLLRESGQKQIKSRLFTFLSGMQPNYVLSCGNSMVSWQQQTKQGWRTQTQWKRFTSQLKTPTSNYRKSTTSTWHVSSSSAKRWNPSFSKAATNLFSVAKSLLASTTFFIKRCWAPWFSPATEARANSSQLTRHRDYTNWKTWPNGIESWARISHRDKYLIDSSLRWSSAVCSFL